MNKLEECGSNQKLLWQALKSEIIPNKRQKSTKLDYVKFNGEKSTDLREISNKFNDYFIDSVILINESIDDVSDTFLGLIKNYESEFKFEIISINKLVEILSILKNNGDNIDAKVLTDAMKIIGDKFVNILNLSLTLGEFPSTWKESIANPEKD